MKKIILLSLFLTGCSLFQKSDNLEKIVYVTAPLYAPERPVLPTWTGDDMSCLSEEMKDKIRDRDQMRKFYAEQLEVIINSTHTK